MVFLPPATAPQLPDIPDSITVHEFMTNEAYGRRPLRHSPCPFVCGVTGRSRNAADVVVGVEYLARAVSKHLGFDPNQGTEWDKVVALYSFNTIDYIPTTHAIHRLGGIVTPVSAAYSVQEVTHQLSSSGAKALFTCVPLLDKALHAARAVGIPNDRIFLMPMPQTVNSPEFKTTDELSDQGSREPELRHLEWIKGQGKRQTAYLSYSSGTSGLPKGVKISHYNVIANILQVCLAELNARNESGVETQVALGVLPFSHIYGLTLIGHVGPYRGDQTIVLPSFTLASCLNAIQTYKIEQLNVVPPILIQMANNLDLVSRYELKSVRWVYSGAAPLSKGVIRRLLNMYPSWHIGQGYGMTEASPVVVTTVENDRLLGSSGSLIPGTRAKLIDSSGNEIHAFDTPGEMLVQSPSVVLGYLNNDKATDETFVWHQDGRWLKTGDEVVVCKSAKGFEHFVVVDRIKELIKVKGYQVAPAELEEALLAHPFVQDCAVISVRDKLDQELPKAYIVRASAAAEHTGREVEEAICKHIQKQKAKYKWLAGGVELVDAIPKSPSGKILRRQLRDRERKSREKSRANL